MSQVNNLSTPAAAWVGAMIEGEGSLGWWPKKYHYTIAVDNTEVETIATLVRLVGGGRVHLIVVVDRKPLWRWTLNCRQEIAALIPQIIPYLTGKRQKAIDLLKLIKEQEEVAVATDG